MRCEQNMQWIRIGVEMSESEMSRDMSGIRSELESERVDAFK